MCLFERVGNAFVLPAAGAKIFGILYLYTTGNVLILLAAGAKKTIFKAFYKGQSSF